MHPVTFRAEPWDRRLPLRFRNVVVLLEPCARGDLAAWLAHVTRVCTTRGTLRVSYDMRYRRAASKGMVAP